MPISKHSKRKLGKKMLSNAERKTKGFHWNESRAWREKRKDTASRVARKVAAAAVRLMQRERTIA